MAFLDAFRNQSLEMTVFNAGKGEAILIKASNKAIFVEGGAELIKENVVLGNRLGQYLRDNNIRLNAIVASHNHVDHLNALSTMLQGEDPQILANGAKFYYNGEEMGKWLTETLMKRLHQLQSKIRIKKISALTRVNWIGNQKITMFVDGRWKPSPVYRSIFMHIPYREARFLLTGDAYIPYENELVKDPSISPYIKTDVLKITHHGSEHGTGEEFLKHAAPVISVASTAADSGHRLEQDVIDRIKVYSRKIFDTYSNDGDIIIRTDGVKRNLQGYNGILFEVEVRSPSILH
ncbi:MAG: competence protein ComEC [Candidatus Nitrosomirales archaeon]|jgi:competence protein ComEC